MIISSNANSRISNNNGYYKNVLIYLLFLFVSAHLVAFDYPKNSTQDGADAYSAGNIAQAARILLPIAEYGDDRAQLILAMCYDQGGNGFRSNMTEAIKYYKKSAASNNELAQYCLGQIYGLGKGVPEDQKVAAEWLYKSAENGNADALGWLGRKYDLGLGVEKNKIEAAALYELSIQFGSEDFNKYCVSIKRSLTDKTLGMVQERITDWKLRIDKKKEYNKIEEIKKRNHEKEYIRSILDKVQQLCITSAQVAEFKITNRNNLNAVKSNDARLKSDIDEIVSQMKTTYWYFDSQFWETLSRRLGSDKTDAAGFTYLQFDSKEAADFYHKEFLIAMNRIKAEFFKK